MRYHWFVVVFIFLVSGLTGCGGSARPTIPVAAPSREDSTPAPPVNPAPPVVKPADPAPKTTKETPTTTVRDYVPQGFSMAGKYLTVPGPNNTVQVYDMEAGQVAYEFLDQPVQISSLAFRPEFAMGLAGSFGGQIQFFQKVDTEGLDRFAQRQAKGGQNMLVGHLRSITSLYMHPEGRLVASGDAGGQLRVWEIPIAEPRSISSQVSSVQSIAVSPDGKIAAVGGRDGAVALISIEEGQVVGRLEGHSEAIKHAVIDSRGELLATADQSGRVRIWRLASGTLLDEITVPAETISGISFHPSVRSLYIASTSGEVRLNRFSVTEATATEKSKKLSALATGEQFVDFTVSQDGSVYAGLVSNGKIRFGRTDAGLPGVISLEPPKDAQTLSISPDGQILVALTSQGFARVWKTEPVSHVADVHVDDGHVAHVPLASGEVSLNRQGGRVSTQRHDSQIVAASQAEESKPVATELKDRETFYSFDDTTVAVHSAQGTLKLIDGHKGAVTAVDGEESTIISGDKAGKIVVWDRDKQKAAQTHSQGSPVSAIQMSTDRAYWVTGSPDGILRFWKSGATDMDELEPRPSTDGPFRIIADGPWIGRVSPKSISLWDKRTGKFLRDLSHGGLPQSIAIHEASGSVICGEQNGKISVHSIAQMDEPVQLTGHRADIVGLQICSRSTLVTTDSAGAIRQWDLANLGSQSTNVAKYRLERLLISPDEKTGLAVANGELTTFQVDSGDAGKTYRASDRPVVMANWVSNSQILVVDADRKIVRWNIDTDAKQVVEGELSDDVAAIYRRNNDEAILALANGTLANVSARGVKAYNLKGEKGYRFALGLQGNRLIRVASNGQVTIESLDGTKSASAKTPAGDGPLDVSADGRWGAYVNRDGKVTVIDTNSGMNLGEIDPVAVGGVKSLKIHTDGRHLITATNQAATLWTQSGELLETRSFSDNVSSLAMVGRSIFALSDVGILRTWRPALVTSTGPVGEKCTHQAVTANGGLCYLAMASGEVACWNLTTKKEMWRTKKGVAISSLVCSSSGNNIVLLRRQGNALETLNDKGEVTTSDLSKEKANWLSANSQYVLFGTSNGVIRGQLESLNVVDTVGSSQWTHAGGSTIGVTADGLIHPVESNIVGSAQVGGVVVSLLKTPQDRVVAVNEHGAVSAWKWSGEKDWEVPAGKGTDNTKVRIVALSEDGRHLAIGRDSRAELWDLSSRTRLWSAPIVGVPTAAVADANRTIFAVENRGLVGFNKAGALSTSTRTEGRTTRLFRRGDRIVAVSDRQTATEVSPTTESSRQFVGLGGKIIQADENGLFLVSGTGEKVRAFAEAGTTRFLLSQSSPARIVAVDRTGMVRVYDINREEALTSFKVPEDLRSVYLMPGSPRLAGLEAGGRRIGVWNMDSGARLEEIEVSGDQLAGAGFSKQGDLITVSQQGSIERRQLRVEEVISAGDGRIVGISSPVADRPLVVVSSRGFAQSWRTDSSKLIGEYRPEGGHTFELTAISSDGSTAVGIAREQGQPSDTMRIWKPTTQEEKTAINFEGRISAVAFGGDDRTVAAVADRILYLCDTMTGKVIEAIELPAEATSIGFGPFRHTVLIGSADGQISVIQSSGRRLINSHSAPVVSTTILEKGDHVISAGQDGAILGWSIADGTARGAFVGPKGMINKLAVLPQGRGVIGASLDGNVYVWPISGMSAGAQIEPIAILKHPAPVNDVVVGGTDQILTACDDQVVRVWDARTFKEKVHLVGHTAPIVQVSFEKDLDQVISCDQNSQVKRWPRLTSAPGSPAGEITKINVTESRPAPIRAKADERREIAGLEKARTTSLPKMERKGQAPIKVPNATPVDPKPMSPGDDEASVGNTPMELLADQLRKANDATERATLRKQFNELLSKLKKEDLEKVEDPAMKLIADGYGPGRSETLMIAPNEVDQIPSPIKLTQMVMIKTDYKFDGKRVRPVHLTLTSDGKSIVAVQAADSGGKPSSAASSSGGGFGSGASGGSAGSTKKKSFAGEPGVVRVYDVETRIPLRAWSELQSEAIVDIKLTPDESKILVLPNSFAFDLNTGRSQEMQLHRAFSISPKSRLIAMGFSTKQNETQDGFELFDAETLQSKIKGFPVFESFISALRFSNDGERFYAAIREWKRHRLIEVDARTLKEVSELGSHFHRGSWDEPSFEPGVTWIETSADANDVVYTYGHYAQGDFRLTAWMGRRSKVIRKAGEPFANSVTRPFFPIRGTTRLGILNELELQVVDAGTGKTLVAMDLKSHHNGSAHLAVSQDGRWLASGGDSGEVSFWDLATPSGPYKFRPHISHIVGLAFSPNTGILATAGEGNVITMWSIAGFEGVPKFVDEKFKKSSKRPR